ncbi:hypothetical protein BDV93DRAFT_567190 [Ceratobasidium sp. AG-I]|nr:hypothetical protein BDV93DRAFT_567190 [Ceratobasidium sp. AG-I]
MYSAFWTNGETWTATLSGPGSETCTLQITGNTMSRAILTAELVNVAFDFGPVVFKNLVITEATAASGRCGKSCRWGTLHSMRE